jgi:hypothetical protein
MIGRSKGIATAIGALVVCLCSLSPNAFGQAAQGLQIVTKASPASSDWWRSPDIYCPTGKKLLSLGGDTYTSDDGAWGKLLFRGLIPNSTLTGGQSAAQEDKVGVSDKWILRTWAICANALPGLQLVTSTSPYSSASPRTWSVSCPVGKRVIGAGGTISGATRRVMIQEIRPNQTLEQVTVVASEDRDGTSSYWYLIAYAVCAYPPPGLVRITAESPLSSVLSTQVTATCPPEKRLLGVGGGVSSGPAGRIVLEWMASIGNSLESAHAKARWDRYATTSQSINWKLRAHAICADG